MRDYVTTYKFDKLISFHFNEFLPRIEKYKHLLKNSLELKKAFNNFMIPENYKITSLGVVSLFKNLYADLIISGMKKKWIYLRNCINLTPNEGVVI